MDIFNKNFFIIIAGNILDYYDFLLFAHLGSFIINKFIPLQGATNAHLLSLTLFGISFFARPMGGYFFGYLSDRYGRIFALSKAIMIAAFATTCFTFLPDYNQIGKLSIYLFILLRLIQGASIGGEYTTAGIYLMEKHSKSQGLISGILCASGTIGSLFGLGFAFLYSKHQYDYLWRLAFFIGGIASFVAFLMRKNCIEVKQNKAQIKVKHITTDYRVKAIFLSITGLTTGALTWVPMTYTNFYFTKILNKTITEGLIATLICMLSYLPLSILFGVIFDKAKEKARYIFKICLIIAASDLIGFILLSKGNVACQFFLTIGATSLCCIIHPLMSSVIRTSRGKIINLYFSIGLGIGSLLPSISGYVFTRTGNIYFPYVIIICILSAFCLNFRSLGNKITT